MKKITYILVSFFFSSVATFGQIFVEEANPELMHVFPNGTTPDSMRYHPSDMEPVGPTTFVIDGNGNYVFMDHLNGRFCGFNKSFKPVFQISGWWFNYIFLLENRLFAFDHLQAYAAVFEYSESGLNLIFSTKEMFPNLHEDLKAAKAFLVDNIILFDTGREYISIEYDRMSKKKPILRNWQDTKKLFSENYIVDDDYRIVEDKDNFNYIFFHDFPLVNSVGTIMNILGETNKVVLSDNSTLYIIDDYQGKDMYGNYYGLDNSLGGRFFVVSKKGVLLRAISFPKDKMNTSNLGIAPNGDVYYLQSNKSGHYFYRIKNTWTVGSALSAYENIMKTAVSMESRVRVRGAANLQGETLGHLEKGDRVEVLEQSGQKMRIGEMEDYWYRVRRLSDGLTGWAYGYFLKREQ